ncbi:MAG: SspB family protein [Ahrensia sp.]|nr:SspB family protein [Ahrensia sp.]
MTEDILRYDILVQNALRGVIRKVLSEIDKTGLPGNHHFFITFMTQAPGVKVSNRVKEQYPEQMTIVLQHQFWELEVNETGFGIGLSFSEIPEKLYIPYSAIRGFYDPSVNFELEFDVDENDAAETQPDNAEGANLAVVKPATDITEISSTEPKTKEQKSASVQTETTAESEGGEPTADVVSLDAFRKKK